MRIDATKYGNEAALLSLAEAVVLFEVRDDAGNLIAYDVDGELDLSGYAAAVKRLAAAPRSASGYTLLRALTDDQANALKLRDVARLSARGSDLIPQDSAFVARVAGAVGVKPAAWFDKALSSAAT